MKKMKVTFPFLLLRTVGEFSIYGKDLDIWAPAVYLFIIYL